MSDTVVRISPREYGTEKCVKFLITKQKVLLSIPVSTVITSSSILVVDFSARCLAALLVSFAFFRFFFLGEASSAASEKDIYFSVRGEAFLKL